MHVHAYEIAFLLFFLPCVSASRVRLAGYKDGDEELFVPGPMQLAARGAVHHTVRVPQPLMTGLFAKPDKAPDEAGAEAAPTLVIPPENTIAETSTSKMVGPGSAKSRLLEGCGRWSSETSPSTGLAFLIVFQDTDMRRYAGSCRKEEAEMLDSLVVQPGDFDQMVDLDRKFLNAVKAGWAPDADWVAFVAQHNVIKAVFTGNNKARIDRIEATQRDPVRGAVSWGFSMLLHRLKLMGFKEATLDDDSDPVPRTEEDQKVLDEFEKAEAELQTVVDVRAAGGIDLWIRSVEKQKSELEANSGDSRLQQIQLDKLNSELEFVNDLRAKPGFAGDPTAELWNMSSQADSWVNRLRLEKFSRMSEIDRLRQVIEAKGLLTKGARVYSGTGKPKHPYTYKATKVEVFNDKTVTKFNERYSYDLTTEKFGSEYGEDEPY